MTDEEDGNSHWLLALESSTSHGGAALLRNGEIAGTARLAEGLRHGRELMPAAAALLEQAGIAARDLAAVAVSGGPGSYTGIRVGVMAAKALAYGSGRKLVSVSSLAAMALTMQLEDGAQTGATVLVLQDARRDEVYAGLYRLGDRDALALRPDAAVAPEEAAGFLAELVSQGSRPLLAGSGFSTYARLFSTFGEVTASPAKVHPGAVGLLGWRQLLREESADPLLLQPEYLRRDAGHDWTHDTLIQTPPPSARD